MTQSTNPNESPAARYVIERMYDPAATLRGTITAARARFASAVVQTGVSEKQSESELAARAERAFDRALRPAHEPNRAFDPMTPNDWDTAAVCLLKQVTTRPAKPAETLELTL